MDLQLEGQLALAQEGALVIINERTDKRVTQTPSILFNQNRFKKEVANLVTYVSRWT